MKTIEIDETATQYVIKGAGSDMAHVVSKDNPKHLGETFAAVLAEQPEKKDPAEAKGSEASDDAPELEGDVEEVLDDARRTMNTLLDLGRDLLGTPEGQKAKGILGRLPQSKRFKERNKDSA